MNPLLHHKGGALHYCSAVSKPKEKKKEKKQRTNNSITPPPACCSVEHTSFDLKFTSYCKLMMIPVPRSLTPAAAAA